MNPLRSVAFAAAVSFACLAPANAQTAPSPTPSATAPVPGANSFTEAQAKERMEKAGFAQVTSLTKDDQGIWRASGMQGDKKVNVALDFQGNVVATQ
jgi:putative membrane protein